MKKKNEIKKYDANILENIGREGEFLSLTDLWKAAGGAEAKAPKHWLGNEQTKGFIHALAKFLKVTDSYLLKIKRGKSGGSYGHKQIALEYAQYLDQNLGVLVNQVFFERVEEEKNPDLIVDRAISTYQKKGKDEKWIRERVNGKLTRNSFTRTLAAHGVQREGYRNCTNAIYEPLYGGGASVVRMKKNLSEKENIRDHLSSVELAAINFAESLAGNRIEVEELFGNAQCEVASRTASNVVRKALLEHKSMIGK